MKYLTLILFASICFSNCEKIDKVVDNYGKEPYDTIFPGEYFPAYPGSWWKYKTDTGTYLTYQSEPKYTLMHFKKGDKPWLDYCYKCSRNTYRQFYEELIDTNLYPYNYVYLPSILGRFISGYNFVINTWIDEFPVTPSKSDFYKLAKTFFIPELNSNREDYYYSEIAGDGSFSWTNKKWEVVEDYLAQVTVQSKQYSNVFKSTMYYSWTVCTPPKFPYDTTIIISEKWWAKDVGLIKCIGDCQFFDNEQSNKDYNMELVDYHINK